MAQPQHSQQQEMAELKRVWEASRCPPADHPPVMQQQLRKLAEAAARGSSWQHIAAELAGSCSQQVPIQQVINRSHQVTREARKQLSALHVASSDNAAQLLLAMIVAMSSQLIEARSALNALHQDYPEVTRPLHRVVAPEGLVRLGAPHSSPAAVAKCCGQATAYGALITLVCTETFRHETAEYSMGKIDPICGVSGYLKMETSSGEQTVEKITK